MANYNHNPTPINVEYRILADGERLYDKQEFYGTTKSVKAEYAPSESYPGNPMVESIPEPRTAHQIFLACQKEIRNFNYRDMLQKPLSKQIEFLSNMRNIHYVLPMQTMLENAFYMALVTLIIGVLLFLTGFLAELVSRSSQERNKYNIKETIR